MANSVKITVASPVDPSSAVAALGVIPDMPALVGVTIRGLEVEVIYDSEPAANQKSVVEAYAAALPLVARQMQYIKAASEDVEEAIVSGVESDATGTTYIYDSDRDSQLNLIGAAVGQEDVHWHVTKPGVPGKVPVLHNVLQIVAVGKVIKAWKESRIILFQQFKAQMLATTNITDADILHDAWDPRAMPAAL